MKLKKITCIFLLLCLILSGCTKKEETRDVLSIWCLDTEPLKAPLTALIKDYNSALPEGTLPAELRSFPSEKALAAGFDTMRPDILVCSDIRGEALSQQGISRDMSSLLWDKAPKYPDYISHRIPSASLSYFPIGGNVQMIYGKTEELKDIEDLPSLLKKAVKYGETQRLPFITADSFSALFYQCLLSDGKEFHALKLRDGKNQAYIDTYNLLADAAYSGGLICSWRSGYELCRSDYLPCAVLNGSALAGKDIAGMSILPLQGLTESENFLAQLSGMAVTVRDGRSQDSAAAFLSWLFEGQRAAELSLEAGLVPLTSLPQQQEYGELKTLLISLSKSSRLHLPESGCDYLINRGSFESVFRQAVELLG